MRSVLRKAEEYTGGGAITKEFVDAFIDMICVTPLDEGSMRLAIKIFTGDTTEKYLRKLESRAGQMNRESDRTKENSTITTVSGDEISMGHTFKKMVEKYENEISTK